MNWFYFLSVGLGSFVMMWIILRDVILKDYFKKKAKAREEKKAKDEEIARRAADALKDQKVLVICRKKDKSKTTFETVIIDHFMAFGAKVFYVNDQTANTVISEGVFPRKDMTEDSLVFVGTFWDRIVGASVYCLCDFRLIAAQDGEIKAACFLTERNEDELACAITGFCGNVLAIHGQGSKKTTT